MSHRRARSAGAVALAVVAITVSACAPQVQAGPEKVAAIDVSVAGSTTTAALPPGAEFVTTIAVDSAPRAVDEVFVGTLFPGEGRSDLAIVGFDSSGTRWSLSTNPSCAGWAATRAGDGEPLVVALNSDARVEDGILADNTFASGFDSQSGAERWSAKPVFGPITANGALFTGVHKAIMSAEPTETEALMPGDGSELELPDDWSAARVVHEHFGIIVLTQDDGIAALDSVSGEVLWTEPAPGVFVSEATVGHALAVRSENAADQTTVMHLATGEVLIPATQRLASVTSADGTQTVVVSDAGSDPTVTLLNGTGVQWSQPVLAPAALRPVSVGADRVYLDASATRIVLAGSDGTELHRGEFAVPVAVSTSGYGLIPTGTPREYEMVHLGTA